MLILLTLLVVCFVISIHFQLFLDLLFVANHLYPQVIPMKEVKSCFKMTYEIPFHILNLAH